MNVHPSITTASDSLWQQSRDLALVLARRELWLLAATALVDPYHRDRFGRLSNDRFRRQALQAARLLGQECRREKLGPGEADPASLGCRELFAAFDREIDSLPPLYQHLFGLTAVSRVCPACGVEYDSNLDVAHRSQQMADIAGFYAAFGLQPAARAGERLDHLSVESEFLYLVLAKEAAALYAGRGKEAGVCRQAGEKFFAEHMAWWLPAFCRLLLKVAPAGFYQSLAGFLAALCTAERIQRQLPPSTHKAVPRPSPQEPEATCFQCMKSGA